MRFAIKRIMLERLLGLAGARRHEHRAEGYRHVTFLRSEGMDKISEILFGQDLEILLDITRKVQLCLLSCNSEYL